MASHRPAPEPESPLVLRELEPSPVEETPRDYGQESYFPSSEDASTSKSSPLRRATTTLGLSDHSLIWWLNRIHKFSTYPFAAYLVAHITNTSLLPLALGSASAADNYLLLTRPYYQSFPFEESLILGPLALHLTSGLALRVIRRKRLLEQQGAESRAQRRSVPWPKVSGTSALGFALVPLAAGHFGLNRLLPWVVEGGNSGIGLGYVSHGFWRAPVFAWCGFGALVSVGVWHFTWGTVKWLGATPEAAAYATGGTQDDKRRVARRRRWLINGVSALITAIWMAGGLGVVGRGGKAIGWEAKNYDRLLEQVPVIGKWI